MCLTGGCNGGSGTNGNGRTPYTPKKTGHSMSGGKGRSSGDNTRTIGTTSKFGTAKVKASFSKKK